MNQKDPIVLTEEQSNRLKQYTDQYIKIASATHAESDEVIEDAISDIYSCYGATVPEIVIVDTPYEAILKVIDLQKTFLKEWGIDKATPANLLAIAPKDELKTLVKQLDVSIPSNEKEMEDLLQKVSARETVVSTIRTETSDFQKVLKCYYDIKVAEKELKNIREKKAEESSESSVDVTIEDALDRAARTYAEKQLDNFRYGQQTLFLGFHKFLHDENLNTYEIDFQKFHDASLKLFWYLPFGECCVVSRKPTAVHVNDRSQFHCEDGPAICWKNPEYNHYYWKGISMNAVKEVFADRSKITPEMIADQKNAEIRRALLEMFGFEKFMKAGGFRVLDESTWGRLLQKDLGPNEDPLTMVEVVNSTAEPDGSWKKYMLNVDHLCRPLDRQGIPSGQPQALTALNAIASTFGLTGEVYGGKVVFQS